MYDVLIEGSEKNLNFIKGLMGEMIDSAQIKENNLVNDVSLENEIKENKGFYDVMVDFRSTYSGGTETLRNIIEDMQNKEIDIQIAYEFHKGRKGGDDFYGFDTDFVIVMPSSAFEEFNSRTHEDQKDSKYDVIGERRSHFSFPYMNKDVSLQVIKDAIEKNKAEIGTTELCGSNYESKK